MNVIMADGRWIFEANADINICEFKKQIYFLHKHITWTNILKKK